jgi:hypothetical protein
MSTLKVGTIQDHANSITAMTIDSAGRVGKPNLPYGQASSDAKTVATAVVNLNQYVVSGGGMTVDTTNNRIIVPVAGLYMIGFHELADIAGYTEVIMRKNGTAIQGGRGQTGTSSQYGNFGAHVIISLAASDYIDWYGQAGTTHNNKEYNNHYVYLIG